MGEDLLFDVSQGVSFMIGSGNGEEIVCMLWIGEGRDYYYEGVWGDKSDEKGTVVEFKAFCLVLVFGICFQIISMYLIITCTCICQW